MVIALVRFVEGLDSRLASVAVAKLLLQAVDLWVGPQAIAALDVDDGAGVLALLDFPVTESLGHFAAGASHWIHKAVVVVVFCKGALDELLREQVLEATRRLVIRQSVDICVDKSGQRPVVHAGVKFL